MNTPTQRRIRSGRFRSVCVGLLSVVTAHSTLADGPSTQPTAAATEGKPPLAPAVYVTSEKAAVQPPATTRPTRSVRVSPFGDRLLRLSDILGPAMGTRQMYIEPSEPADADEWQDIATFAKQNFPNRWAQFENVQKQRGADSPLVASLKDRMTTRYRTLQKLQNQMPGLYEAAVRQGRLEDDAWGATVAARRKPKDATLAKSLRDKVGALVKDVLQERQDRLDALKQTLQDEQDRLDADQKGLDKLIDRQIDRLTGDRPFESDLPNRWGGRGGFGQGGPGGGFGPGGGGFGPGGYPGRWDGGPRGEGRRRSDNNNTDAPATQPTN